MERPLSGIKVLDVSRILAGPWCTAYLADMGAEVIKIEKPKTGDDSHIFGPFVNGVSSYFMLFNRGKKGITLDIKSPQGLEIFKRMVKECDVVVENFRCGVADKLGIGYEALKQINPRLVYASISGFGQYGPSKDLPAYDPIVQGISGLMSINGHPTDPPTKVGCSIADVSAGTNAALGILLALYARERTGQGQHVDVSLLDSVFCLMESNIVRYTMGGGKILPTRLGSRHPISAPMDTFKAEDGYLYIAVANDALFKKLSQLMDLPDLPNDPRFSSDHLRASHADDLQEIIESWLADHTVDGAVKMLGEAGIPACRINTVAEACHNPQIKEREMLVEIDHPQAGCVQIIGNPIKLSETPAVIKDPSPTLGQHNYEVLQSFGYSTEEINQFIKAGVM